MEIAAGLVLGIGIGLVMKAIYRRGMATPRDSRAVWVYVFLFTTLGLVFAVRAIGDLMEIVARDDRRIYMRANAAGIFLGFFALAPLIWRRRDHSP